MTPLLFSKMAITVILAILLYYLFQTGKYGRRISGISNETSSLHSSMKSKYLAVHRRYAEHSFWIAILAVVAVETVVRFNEPVYGFLFWIHLCVFAIPCFTLLVLIRFKYTGLKRPDVHSKLLYRGLLPTLVGTLLTGIPLLYQL